MQRTKCNWVVTAVWFLAFPLMAGASGTPTQETKELTLYTAPVGVGVLLVDVANSGALDKYAEHINVVRWNSPDQLRAGIIDDSIDISFVPSYAGANLYNKGIEFQLLNIITGGMLYVISRDHSIKSIDDLEGKTIHVPFPNDMPDLVLQALLKRAGLGIGDGDNDVQVQYVATPKVAVQLAMAGKADTLLLPEVAATKIKMAAQKKKGLTFAHVIDVQREWGRLMQTKPYIPQAGVAVRASFARQNPELVQALNLALKDSAAALLQDEERLLAMTDKLWPNQGPVFAASIDRWNIDVQSSMDVKPELEQFYRILQDLNPSVIGGRLPDDGYYYR